MASIIHTRIVGVGWLLIGLFGLLSSANSIELRVAVLLSLIPQWIISLALIFVSYGILRRQLWSRVACQVVSIISLGSSALVFLLFLAISIATRDEPHPGPSSGTIIWLSSTLPFILFSIYSLMISLRE